MTLIDSTYPDEPFIDCVTARDMAAGIVEAAPELAKYFKSAKTVWELHVAFALMLRDDLGYYISENCGEWVEAQWTCFAFHFEHPDLNIGTIQWTTGSMHDSGKVPTPEVTWRLLTYRSQNIREDANEF